jgi:hypothetical protein
MFYAFNQNNSGGSFIMDDNVAHFVIIEADSVDAACDKAEEVGIYFDGIDKGYDCECCGDRWYQPWDSEETPMIYGQDPADYEDMWTPEGKAYAYVYYKDGTKRSYIQKPKGEEA